MQRFTELMVFISEMNNKLKQAQDQKNSSLFFFSQIKVRVIRLLHIAVKHRHTSPVWSWQETAEVKYYLSELMKKIVRYHKYDKSFPMNVTLTFHQTCVGINSTLYDGSLTSVRRVKVKEWPSKTTNRFSHITSLWPQSAVKL